MDITLRQIRSFLAIAHLGSFTRAASLLHISQPALTVQIRNLETALGVKLLDRTSRSVEVTRLGRELLPSLQRALRDLEAAMADVHEVGAGRRGTVRVAANRAMKQMAAQAGKRAAAIMSLLATAKANGIDPHAWLTDTLARLPTTLDRNIDTLLPLRQD